MENSRFEQMGHLQESSPEFLSNIRERLLAEKARLESDLSPIARRGPAGSDGLETVAPQLGSDEEENAAEITRYEIDQTVGNELEKDLRDVNFALQRLDQSTYGLCRHCKKSIGAARLLARPASSSCIECKRSLTLER